MSKVLDIEKKIARVYVQCKTFLKDADECGLDQREFAPTQEGWVEAVQWLSRKLNAAKQRGGKVDRISALTTPRPEDGYLHYLEGDPAFDPRVEKRSYSLYVERQAPKVEGLAVRLVEEVKLGDGTLLLQGQLCRVLGIVRTGQGKEATNKVHVAYLVPGTQAIRRAHLKPERLELVPEEDLPVDRCGRCQGVGFLPHYHYIEDGVCFQCRGQGCMSTKED